MKLLFICADAYAFLERHRKDPSKARLTISCHGNDLRQVEINDISMGANQFSQEIRKWMNGEDIHSLRTIRLVACKTANLDPATYRARLGASDSHYWSSAFGAQLSLFFPNVHIKSYVGFVVGTCPTDTMWERYQELGRAQIEIALKDFFSIDKFVDLNDVDESPFRCITFLNGVAVKESQQITHERGNDYFPL